MNRRFAALALTTSVVASLVLAAPAAAAGPAIPLPATMAAVGDSITQAASSAGSLGADAPQNSWSTGTSASVNSHYQRLLSSGATGLAAHNLSVSGAKVADLPAQTAAAAGVQPDYLTVLIGGNDVCTSTASSMTAPAQFEADFRAALGNVDTSRTHVYVVSIPRVMGLWELFRNNFLARFVWSVGAVCQSLLANPTSTAQADVDRRAQVDARNRAFNEILARVCSETPNCHHDGGAAFNTVFTTADVSGDYFHPSVAGQAKLAATSWTAGYTWAAAPPPPNEAPTASFTESCNQLTCSFTDGSADTDGTIAARSWTFGDSGTSSATNPLHTYAAGGVYTVSLTVTDDDGASTSTSHNVSVTAPPAPTAMWVAGLSSSAAGGRNSWTATVTITARDAAGPIPGVAVTGTWTSGSGTSTCTTSSAGTCQVTVTVNKKTTSTRYTVSGLSKSGWTYQAGSNAATSITVARP